MAMLLEGTLAGDCLEVKLRVIIGVHNLLRCVGPKEGMRVVCVV